MNELDIELKYECPINYSLIHTGLEHLVKKVKIVNQSGEILKNRLLEIVMLGLSEPWRKRIMHINPGDCWVCNNGLTPPSFRAEELCIDRLCKGSSPAKLCMEAHINGDFQKAYYGVSALPLCAWEQSERCAKATAAFVFPEHPVVLAIITRTNERLRLAGKPQLADLELYEAVKELYSCWREDLGISYHLERPGPLGSYQLIRCLRRMRLEKRGTCIDLAFLMAACIEYTRTYPLIIILRMEQNSDIWNHTIVGFWRIQEGFIEPVIDDKKVLLSLLDSNPPSLSVLDPEVLARGGDFKESLTEAEKHLRKRPLVYAVDIQTARDKGVWSLPCPEGNLTPLTVILSAFRKLCDEQQAVIQLVEIEGRSLKEVAKISRRREDEVINLLSKAHEMLKQQLWMWIGPTRENLKGGKRNEQISPRS